MRESVVITGLGLTSPLGDNLEQFRLGLLEGRSGITPHEVRYMGTRVAGLCSFPEDRYQSRKARRRGTRAGAIGNYCAGQALENARVDLSSWDREKIGVYVGITEHGNVETEQEIYELHQNDRKTEFWSPHHNPRTVANAPAGEITLNFQLTGPHYTIGAACAGGNAGLIQGLQMLQLGEIDLAIAGGVSESPQSFGIFAGFEAQGALGSHENPQKSIRPLDLRRNGTVISEGGCLFILERESDARKRGAPILAKILGHAMNSDASDFVNPNPKRQARCLQMALERAGLRPEQIDLISLHATATGAGDISEMSAVKEIFGTDTNGPFINFTKGHIGHTMGAAGALELAGNLPSLWDGKIHPGIHLEQIDPLCAHPGLVYLDKRQADVKILLNNSFGMLGTNSVVIVGEGEK